MATISLAVKYQAIMTVPDGNDAGDDGGRCFWDCCVGIVMGKKIPERVIKWGAALIFIGFGVVGLYENLPTPMLTPLVLMAGTLTIILMIFLVAWWNNRKLTLSSVQESQDGADQNRTEN